MSWAVECPILYWSVCFSSMASLYSRVGIVFSFVGISSLYYQYSKLASLSWCAVYTVHQWPCVNLNTVISMPDNLSSWLFWDHMISLFQSIFSQRKPMFRLHTAVFIRAYVHGYMHIAAFYTMLHEGGGFKDEVRLQYPVKTWAFLWRYWSELGYCIIMNNCQPRTSLHCWIINISQYALTKKKKCDITESSNL